METKVSLREAVQAEHLAAEKTDMAKALIHGPIAKKLYHGFLYNMCEIYNVIEQRMPDLPDSIKRYNKYLFDLEQLDERGDVYLPTASLYVTYLKDVDNTALWAHIYVHYLGNMYGGQMIKKNIPWSSTHLDFDNPKESIAYVRANIVDINHEEAKTAFNYTLKLYDELYFAFGPNS